MTVHNASMVARSWFYRQAAIGRVSLRPYFGARSALFREQTWLKALFAGDGISPQSESKWASEAGVGVAQPKWASQKCSRSFIKTEDRLPSFAVANIRCPSSIIWVRQADWSLPRGEPRWCHRCPASHSGSKRWDEDLAVSPDHD